MKRAGFTLIELSLCAIVVGILVAGGVYAFKSSIDSARNAQAMTVCTQIASAISQYKYENKAYPATLANLLTVSPKSGNAYLSGLPAADPWGTTIESYGYLYRVNNNVFMVFSYGQDKIIQSSSTPPTISGDDVGVVSK
ncbi:MAG: type II secretion system protein GspG [Patescibacteria group bacterium]